MSERYELAKAALAFADTVAKLRSENGCPWDREQTFDSLQKYMIEEAYESVEAAQKLFADPKNVKNANDFCSELGDVLLQIYLNSQIAQENNLFSLTQVYKKINQKMIERHPHVFKSHLYDIKNATDVENIWEKIKDNEQIKDKNKSSSLIDKALKKSSLPTLNYGTQISKHALKVGFSWQTLRDVFRDVENEVEELKQELTNNMELEKVKDELGDVIYALCNLVSFIKETNEDAKNIDFDILVRSAYHKFINRFHEMEKIMHENNKPLTEEVAKKLTLDQWNELWKQAKKRRYR